jgi:hypothetical protein
VLLREIRLPWGWGIIPHDIMSPRLFSLLLPYSQPRRAKGTIFTSWTYFHCKNVEKEAGEN